MRISKEIVRRISSVKIYEVTEKELTELERGLPKIINVFSPTLGCLALSISFIKDLIEKDPSEKSFLILLSLACLFLGLGFFILFYSVASKKNQKDVLAEIRANNEVEKKTIASNK